MPVKVLFFGQLGDVAETHFAKRELSVSLDHTSASIEQLIESICQKHPEAQIELLKNNNLYAVNEELCDLKTVLKDGDEVAFMSPLSGG